MMKNLFAVILTLIILVLSSCEAQKINTNNEIPNEKYNLETDMQYYYRNQCNVLPVTASPEGYYYVGKDGIIIYIEKNTLKAVPLCNKANCRHDNMNICDAYQVDVMMLSYFEDESSTAVIQYYEDHIYTIGFEENTEKELMQPYLKRLDLDGANSTRITNTLDVFIREWFIHKGYFYYAIDTGLYRISLNSPKSESEIVFKVNNVEKNSNNVSEVFAINNFIYFIGSEFDSKNNISYASVYVYNINSSECKKIEYEGKSPSITTVLKDKILFQIGNINKNKVTFYKSDYDLNNSKILTTQRFGDTLFADDKYIYITDIYNLSNTNKKQSITVYDYDMNKVDNFVLAQCTLAGQDENCFLVWLEDENKESYLYAIDKAQIGTINGKIPEMKKLCKLKWSKDDTSIYR